jgi:TrmH family RNA methyltransferase
LRRAHRREEDAFLLEGPRAISDALERGAAIDEVFVGDDHSTDPVAALASGRGIPVHVVGPGIIKALSDSITPQGIVAVARSPLRTIDAIERVEDLVVVLAAVADPGNVGTLVRSAAGARSDGVVVTTGGADPLNPKTVRAAAAALFEIPVVTDLSTRDAVEHLRGLGYQVVGSDSAASTTIYDVDLRAPSALVVGNESRGLSGEDRRLVDVTAAIPMPGPIESLNAAMAGSILLFECLRQRRG